MVTLSSQSKQVSRSSAPTPQDVVSLTTPLTLSSVHQLWTQALSLTPPSPSLSLTHLKRLLRTLNLLPRPLLTPVQTAPLYLNVALILAYLGEYFLAAESFHKAIELEEDCAIGWHGLGGMKFLLGDWKAARKAWNTCLACLGSRQTLKYRVWQIGGTGAETEKGKKVKEWVLEKVRVEWNRDFALLSNKEEREQLQERVWDINGIPAGMVFGPSFLANSDNFHDAKENNGLKNGHIEGAKANALQHIHTSIPLTNTRTSSHTAETSTKPLPALPDHPSWTPAPLPRVQKGLSLSKLFTRPRTSSASKNQALKPKRPDLPAAPLTWNDPSSALLISEERYSGATSATRAGRQMDTFDHTAATNPELFNAVFDTDSGSDRDAKLDADELKFYFSTESVPEVDMKHAATSSAPAVSASFPPLPPRTISYRPGRIQFPLMEMREEIRQEMRERERSFQVRGGEQIAIATYIEDREGKKAMAAVENKVLNRITPTARKEDLHETTAKLKRRESKEGSAKVEGMNWNRTAIKAEENKRNGFARNLQLEHKDMDSDKVEFGKEEVPRRERRSGEPQEVASGRRAEKKEILETVLELNIAGESQETEEKNQLRGRSERRSVEDQTGVSSRKAEKGKTAEAISPFKSQKVEEKNEMRGNSRRRNPETLTAVKGREEPKEKILELGTATSQTIKRSVTKRKEPQKPDPAKVEPTTQEPELEYLKPVRFEGFNGEWRKKDLEYEAEARMKEPELEYLKPVGFEGFNGEWRKEDLEYGAEARVKEAEARKKEPELEYLKPVRFEGFNGEWRKKDLEYEAEARMEKARLNGGK
ncbi:hypothetical protein MMC29_002501 [Sticta canariensis]|nr:hypothetical protein [Sticta canariensis]